MKFKYGGFNNPGFNALPKNVQAKIKARTFGDGGTMPQLTEFNEGGRHEENVLGVVSLIAYKNDTYVIKTDLSGEEMVQLVVEVGDDLIEGTVEGLESISRGNTPLH
jgi:hypothetical protein